MATFARTPAERLVRRLRDLLTGEDAALDREMKWYAEQLPAPRATSTYVGGGTTTVLDLALPAVVARLRRTFDP